ncbi:DNA pilot protein [Dipodfec virus UOA04_Rod_680]|nr:DNA pilot protein [Dipodfec virus UOA04_Rod_680]
MTSALSSMAGSSANPFVFAGNQLASSLNSRRAWKYAKKSMALQYQYQLKGLRESPSAQREGLEAANYNPLLALGSGGSSAGSVSPSFMNSDSDSGYQSVSSAIDAMNARANVKNVKANTELVKEQAETERAKRVQMDFQNAMTDVETHLKQKDLDTYDKRFYANLYEQMQRAENYRASSAIGMMNAETERMNAETNKANSALDAVAKRRYNRWIESHPHISGAKYYFEGLGAPAAAVGGAIITRGSSLLPRRKVGF